MGTDPAPLRVAFRLDEIFHELTIPYFIGGSVASSLIGEPRSTNDIDIVAEIPPEKVDLLFRRVEKEFYADLETVRNAVKARTSFNLVHIEGARKADVFLLKGDPFDREQMARRKLVRVAQDPDRSLWIASPEDILLSKLRWYRSGGETSDRQWRDLLGILKVRKASLDRAYLERWAARIEVQDLLQRLFGAV